MGFAGYDYKIALGQGQCYTYDPVRLMLPVNLSLPNTGYITNRYDLVARLLTTKLNNWSGTTLDSALYGYNAGSQRTTFTNAAGTHVNYTYDPIGQLKIGASSVSSENRGYAYDAAWNLNTRTNNGVATSFGVNGLNELTSVGSSTTFGYDGNGNLTNKAVGGAHPLTYIYTFDDESRLAGVQTNNSTGPIGLTTFVYDGLGRLREQLQWTYSSGAGGGGGASAIRRTVSTDSSGSGWNLSGGTLYIYDGRRVIQERDAIYNNPLVSYTRGNDLSGRLEGAGGIGGLLARSDGYASGSFTSHNFYHADGNGNITYLVNSGQTLAASYRYDPFGNLTSSSGTLASANSYRFSGKEFMTSVGLYYYLYRFYDPSTQRWPNRDPLGEMGFEIVRTGVPTQFWRLFPRGERIGGPNLYECANNNPIDYIDYDGRDLWQSVKSGAGMVCTAVGNTWKVTSTIVGTATGAAGLAGAVYAWDAAVANQQAYNNGVSMLNNKYDGPENWPPWAQGYMAAWASGGISGLGQAAGQLGGQVPGMPSTGPVVNP